MARPKLTVDKRTITGRKVKTLRHEGLLPGNLYGQNIKSQALKLDYQDFLTIFKKTGESGLIDLAIGKTKSTQPVLVGDIQIDPVTDKILHVDFRQVDLTKKAQVTVPIELVGQAPGAEEGEGILIQPLSEVEVEALPEKLPDHLEADISSLKEINDAIRVTDLEVDKEIAILADKEEVVAKLEAPTEEEEEPAPVEEPTVIGEEAEEEDGAESEEDKEEKSEGKPEEKSSEKEKPQKKAN